MKSVYIQLCIIKLSQFSEIGDTKVIWINVFFNKQRAYSCNEEWQLYLHPEKSKLF